MSLRSFSLVFTVAAVYFFVFVAGQEQLKLPAEIKTCKRDADDFSSCLRLALQESWPLFVKGIPEFGMPQLDPFYDKYGEFEFGSNEFHGKIITKDIYYYGFKNMKFLAVRPEYTGDRFKLEVDIEMPKGLAEGNFIVNANLINFKLNGEGPFNVSAEDIKVTWFINGPVKNDRWIIEEYRPRPTIRKLKVWAENLFNGNPELTQIALSFMNEFWPTLYRGMIPFVEEVWSKKYSPILNNFFSKLSFNEVFPTS
ncbi:PREDICTED: circadian clock-controlled protein-like [Polistes dominula]|uniref:Circadian clock-controlled protein-like n=1 Tax=Polistes dominula TaxID=743375 RepID=A0ABM1HUP4_POLDO|nr:PREDICTED: circadian clock-controlled protein-like [Polistes dominula]